MDDTPPLTVEPAAIQAWLAQPADEHPDQTRAERLGVDDELTAPGIDGFLDTIANILAAEPDGLLRRADLTRVEVWSIPDGEVLGQGALITVDLADGLRLCTRHQDVTNFARRDQHGIPAVLAALAHIANQVALLLDTYHTANPRHGSAASTGRAAGAHTVRNRAVMRERIDRRISPWPYGPVTDDLVVEALQQLEPWRAAGDSVDWELALIAYDVPADTIVMGVPVPAGLYTREVTGGGHHVIAHRWHDRAALVDRLDDIDTRHHLFAHIAHARPQFVAAHTAAIHAYAHGVLALIERDERPGGPLYDAPVRCWHDLNRHIDEDRYFHELRNGADVEAYRDEDDLVTAVHDRADTLLHERDRPLTFDEAAAAGLDGTLRDGSDPHTWASLTPRQRTALQLDRPEPRTDDSR